MVSWKEMTATPEERNKMRIKRILEELKHADIDGLEEIIQEIKNLKKLGHYERFSKAMHTSWVPGAPFTNKVEARGSKLLTLGHDNLLVSLKGLLIKKPIITFSEFSTLYFVLESIYSINLGKTLGSGDLQKLYLSGVDERVTFSLERFDEVEAVSEPTAEFFQKFKKLKWNRNAKESIFKKINNAMYYTGELTKNSPYWGFPADEKAFNILLSGCSAVNGGRDEIGEKDVIRAYKTYFKLMKTDITKLVDKGVRHYKPKVYDGYLVCNKCGGYYKLQPGESPEDFEECQCGGKLRYVEDVNIPKGGENASIYKDEQ